LGEHLKQRGRQDATTMLLERAISAERQRKLVGEALTGEDTDEGKRSANHTVADKTKTE
jgi:hypothetical protein